MLQVPLLSVNDHSKNTLAGQYNLHFYGSLKKPHFKMYLLGHIWNTDWESTIYYGNSFLNPRIWNMHRIISFKYQNKEKCCNELRIQSLRFVRLQKTSYIIWHVIFSFRIHAYSRQFRDDKLPFKTCMYVCAIDGHNGLRGGAINSGLWKTLALDT